MSSSWQTDILGRSIRRVAPQVAVWRWALGIGLLAVLAAAWMLYRGGALPASGIRDSLLAFVLMSCVLLYASPAAFLQTGPGPGNRITLLRGALVMPLAVAAVYPQLPDPTAVHWLIGLAALALSLDAVDGAWARRSGMVTRFGARFDMELDALLILVLAVLVWRTGQTGIWVLLIGVMRYGFVAASWYWRWLDGELPPSRRRQALCVVQSLALLVALSPLLKAVTASVVALAALLMLTYSFTVDVHWLYRHRPPESGGGGRK